MRVSILILCGILCACATPEEKAAKLVKAHAPVCEALGYKKDTDAFRECILKRITRPISHVYVDAD